MQWVIDLDGVMWRGASAIPGSIAAIGALMGRGDRVLFCTNNSTVSGSLCAARLVEAGIPAGFEVVTSADALCTLTVAGERLLVCGSPGLVDVIREHGSEAVGTAEVVTRSGGEGHPGTNPDADLDTDFGAVVIGLNREFDYAQLDLVCAVVRGGARLLATNADTTFPARDRIQPGTGSLLAAVEAACGVKATVAGKPEPPMARLIGDRLGRGGDTVIVVGDRPDTDGRLAQQMGQPFALVLSGVTPVYAPPLEVPVAMVAEDLASLVSGDILSGAHVAGPGSKVGHR